MKTHCAYCGAALDRFPSRVAANPLQYCDRTCLAAHRRRSVAVVCEICGAQFDVKASRATQNNAITCSPACLATLRHRTQVAFHNVAETRHAVCAHCGCSFTRKPSQLAKYATNYCSQSCKHAAGQPLRPERHTGAWVECETCGQDVWRTPANHGTHVFCSRKCAGRAGQPRPNHPGNGLTGEAHPRWTGGGTYGPEFRQIRKQVRTRDGDACRNCGEPWRPNTGNLVAHHIDMNKRNHDMLNLVTLCRACHTHVHNEVRSDS